MAAKRKTVFYHTRLNRVKIGQGLCAEVLGVDIEQVKAWDENEAPVHVIRFLLLWDKKHIGLVGWSGWMFSRDVLIYKGLRFSPRTILHDREFRESLERETANIFGRFCQ